MNWLLGRDAQAAWVKLAATNSRRADVAPGSPEALPDLQRPGDYADTTYSYSVLRTIQAGFGLGPYLGSAAQVAALPVVWK